MPAAPSVQVHAMKAALIEAGHPDVMVEWGTEGDETNQVIVIDWFTLPDPILWRAYAVCSKLLTTKPACWACWSSRHAGVAAACQHDFLTEPWPPLEKPANR